MKKPKNIFLTPETIQQVAALAQGEDRSIKFFMEREIAKMGENGLSYHNLLTQYERTAQKLRDLTNTK